MRERHILFVMCRKRPGKRRAGEWIRSCRKNRRKKEDVYEISGTGELPDGIPAQ